MADQNIKVNINLDLTEFNKNAKAMSDALSNVLGKDVKMFAAEMSKAEASINGAEKAMKGATTAATKTGNSVKQSNIQWHNLSLIVQDLPFGFRGIQNNLPALGQSIAGFAGPAMFAFSAVIAAITAFDMGLFGAKKKTKELKDETDSLIDSMSQEATRVNSLLAVLANENETRERKNRAIKELQKINPDIFKGLKLETDGVRDLNKFYNAYIENLKNAILLKQDELELQKLVKEDLKRKPVLGPLPKTDPLATGKKLLEETNGILRVVDNNTGKIDNKNKSIINNLAEENKRLATKEEILARIAKRSGSVELAAGTGNNTNVGPKPTVSKVYEELAQEEFNYYKDSIFRAEEYFVKLNNIQKINALMEATIKGASLDELFTIQQTYEQKEINFRKSIEDKKAAIRQQSDEMQKQLTKSHNDEILRAQKDLTDKSVYFTEQRIKAVNTEADASIRANRGNYQAQKQALEEAIVKLGVFRMAGIGGAEAMLKLDEAIGNNKAKIEGLIDPLETLNQSLQTTFNQLNIDLLTNFADQMGAIFAGGKFDFKQLGNILADGLSSIGKALIAFAITNGAAMNLFKDPKTWPLALAAGIAAVAAGSFLRNSMNENKATAFANGGIVSGPTMGLVGEYPGAQNNPEVIAPLDKLKSMIGGGGGGTFVLRGQDLLVSINRTQKSSFLKGQNISLA
jgi:hypothetical protein